MKKIIAIVVALVVLAALALFFIKGGKREDYTGKRVLVDYVGKFPDGKVFDTSIEQVAKENALYTPQRAYTPLTFTVGSQEVIKGFSAGVNGLKIGESRSVTVEPKDGYGEIDPAKVTTIQRSLFQQANIVPQTGQTYQIGSDIVTVLEVGENDVKIDANHPMAGKTLIFDITLKSVEK